MLDAFDDPTISENAFSALEAVEGSFERLLAGPPRRSGSQKMESSAGLETGGPKTPLGPDENASPLSAANGAGAGTGQAHLGALHRIAEASSPPAPPVFCPPSSTASDACSGSLPSRVALVASDPSHRQAVALSLSASGPEIVAFSSLAEAASDPAPIAVVVVDDPIKLRQTLPPSTALGGPRGYVLVGEVTPGYREAIFTSMHKYCDLARRHRRSFI